MDEKIIMSWEIEALRRRRKDGDGHRHVTVRFPGYNGSEARERCQGLPPCRFDRGLWIDGNIWRSHNGRRRLNISEVSAEKLQ
jgi:hypothetical protein